MITIKINNKEIQVKKGTSVMKAANGIGIDIPNLCWHDELPHFTSCMLCLVKDSKTGRLFPSCSTIVTEGMEIITDDEEVGEARRTALELLLSEHSGDCEAPCRIACPANMNIPLMNRLIASDKINEALKVVRRDIALPSVLGRICPAPCEGACHRKSIDEPVSICLLKRFAGDAGNETEIAKPDEKGEKVAVIGSGPAGLAAAYYLQIRGIQVTLFDKNEKCGGQLRSEIPEDILPREILDREIDYILKTGVKFHGNEEIDDDRFDKLKEEYDSIVVATGKVEGGEKFGLKFAKNGIFVNRTTYQTTIENIFAIGNALRSSRLAVRSVGQGKEVAFSVMQFLRGMPVKGEPRLFNSRLGKLTTEEYSEYLKESVNSNRVFPGDGGNKGFSAEEAIAEAKRCMHCDCRAAGNCKLRDYSERYKIDQRRYKTSERRKITKMDTHTQLIYEPEKCIKCGICVRLTRKYGEKFGFTYIGRGFDVRISVPFNEELENALTETARKVAEDCPTGAIELKNK